jgi:hypothetical protein
MLTLTALLAGCGAEEPPRLSDSGPPPARPSTQWKQGDRGALLVATGRQTFEGRSTPRCVVHGDDGLQINLRTGDPELPTVAVRVERFQGEGPYQGRLFLTGRNRTGALVGSTGQVSLEVRQAGSPAAVRERDGQEGSALAVQLDGWFEGSYDGPAGKGSVQGRFGACSFTLPEGLQPVAPEPPGGTRGVAVGP